MQILTRGEPLDRGDGLAVVHHCKRQAGIDAAAIDQHRASAALAVIATLFCACEVEVLAQCIEQGYPGGYAQFDCNAVYGQLNCNLAGRQETCLRRRAYPCHLYSPHIGGIFTAKKF
jgi:hypothetical protein